MIHFQIRLLDDRGEVIHEEIVFPLNNLRYIFTMPPRIPGWHLAGYELITNWEHDHAATDVR